MEFDTDNYPVFKLISLFGISYEVSPASNK